MKKIAVITANTGNFEKPGEHVKQSLACDFYCFDDKNFPPRFNAMTPRLQARIPKMFGYQMAPNYDYYIWIDSSCILSHKDSVKWFIEHLTDSETYVHMAVLKHPNRSTIRQEADYLKERLAKDCTYITPRYKAELIDEQMKEIESDKGFVDTNLFATTAFVYKNHKRVYKLLKEWWYHTSRYHIIDQLSLPYAIWKSSCNVRIVDHDYTKSEYMKYVRNK